jgi:autotransporter-associated beta strand protein
MFYANQSSWLKRAIPVVVTALHGVFACSAYAAEGDWNLNGSGEWHNASNWFGSVPNVPGDAARFFDQYPTTNAIIALHAPATVGELISASPFQITIDAADPIAHSLRFDSGSGVPAALSVLHPSGRVRFDTSLTFSEFGLNVFAASHGSRVQMDRPVSGDGDLVKQGAGMLILNADNANWSGALWINSGLVEVNHAGGLGSSEGAAFVRGGVLRFTQPIQKDIDLDTGRIVAANALGGDVTLRSGELTFAFAGPHPGDITSHGGRVSVESVASVDLMGALDLVGGGVTEFIVPQQRTLNLRGGGAGQGDIYVSGLGTTNVNDAGVHYDGAMNVTGRIAINAPSSVRKLYVDAGELGTAGVEGTGSLSVSESVVLRTGAIRFQSDAPGLETDAPVQKIGLTRARFEPGLAFTGDVLVEAGTLHFMDSGLPETAGVTIVRARNAELYLAGVGAQESIALENATGFSYHGAVQLADSYANGAIDLGEEGSMVGFGTGPGDYHHFEGSFSGGSLQLVGTGTLQLASGNHTHIGETIVGGYNLGSNTFLELNHSGAIHSTAGIVVNDRAALRANNRGSSGGVANEDRIGDDIPITLQGGELTLAGRDGVYINEVIGEVTAAYGESVLGVDIADTNTILSVASLQRSGHATLVFQQVANVDPYDSLPVVLVAEPPTLQNGILGAWATADGTDFVSYSPNAGVHALRDTVLRPGSIAAAGSLSHVELYDSETLHADASIGTLRSFSDVNLNGHALVVEQGGLIIAAHRDGYGLKHGEVTSGVDELVVHAYGQEGYVAFDADVVDHNGDSVAFIKAGSGVIAMSGNSSYSGGTIVNEGVLRLTHAHALPAKGDLALDGGHLQVSFVADESGSEIELGELRLRGFSTTRMQIDGRAPTVRAESYLLESGELSVPLAGDGSIVKTTRGRVTIGSDNPQFSGEVLVENGLLLADFLGDEADDVLQPLGTGQVVINADGILAHRVYSRPAQGYQLDAKIVLNGGEIASGSIDPERPLGFRGTIDVVANSRISLYDADDGQVFANGITMQFQSDVSIHDDVALRTTGPGEVHFDGEILVGRNATIEAIDNQTRLRGVIVSNHPLASLKLAEAENVSLENSVHARAGEQLTITVDDQSVPMRIAGANRFARGGGVLGNSLEITAAGRLQPGDEIGVLRVAEDVLWSDGGVYEWEISSAVGLAGAIQGWDLFHAEQLLDVTATGEQPFVIKLLPQVGADGQLDGFDPFASYEWLIAEANELSASLEGLSIDDSAFRSAFGDFQIGDFQLALGSDRLLLSYSAVVCADGETAPCDGAVDLFDLNAVRNHFGAAGRPGLSGDTYPFDGRVDLHDLNQVRNHFGMSATPVPEPSTSVLVLAASLAFCAGRRWLRRMS